MFGLIKNLLKMLTSKNFLIVLAIAAIAGGAFLYYKKSMGMSQDVDSEKSVEQEIAETVIAMTPQDVEEETKDLGQAPQPMPSSPDSTENFASV